MSAYDLIILGSGPGGYVSAIRASQLGLKAAIVEKKSLGGVCLNVGCIPTKALLRNAEVARTLMEGSKEFGFSFDNLTLDFESAFKRSRQVSQRLVRGVGFLMKKNNIDVFNGFARIISNGTVEITLEDGSQKLIETKNIIIATGANPLQIPGLNVDDEKVINYESAIMLNKRPDSAIIIGAGAIGVEFATIWSSYGTDVTLVEMMPHLLPLEDEDASIELERVFKKRGIKFHTNTKVKSAEATTTGSKVVIEGEDGENTLEADITLVSIGFRANSQGLGLEALGVALDKRGFVIIDDRMATNIPGIWAVGDVTGKLMLAHVASTMGINAAENIAGLETAKLDYQMMPHATFCFPQVAGFGLSEAQARQAGFEVKTGKFPFQAIGKALGLGEYAGFAKIIMNEQNGEILGASLVGPEVSELLPELTLARSNHLKVAAIARNVHTHPTLSEVLMAAAEDAEGYSIHG
ncbi:MAG: dihydrolipoyl dehydrogenase [Anaerolineaceae bacterium]|nr:dihydrolipoyl dehydrogenase [Anaerolineaceae bacterium]